MAKKAPELDTPFKRGEKVLVARAARGVPEGTIGKIKMTSGLEGYDGADPWLRYWVRFDDQGLVGHVSHDDLVRPAQHDQWLDREEARAAAEAAAESAEEAAADAAPAASAGDGIASQIPAHLLERSRAAKARLLGS